MEYAFRRDKDIDLDFLVVESAAIEGYVLSANVDTETRQPKANMLPTRADDADDIS